MSAEVDTCGARSTGFVEVRLNSTLFDNSSSQCLCRRIGSVVGARSNPYRVAGRSGP